MDLLNKLDDITQPYQKEEKVDPASFIYTADQDTEEDMVRQLYEGLPKGTTTYFAAIDPHWKWRSREFNIWTGYNNEGKTTMLNELALCKSVGEGWKHGIFSPENMPQKEFFTELAEVFIGKSADKDRPNCMSEKEIREAIGFLREHFFLVYPPKADFTMENIELAFKYLKDKHDIKTAILDPYLKIRHRFLPGEPEHLYVSRFMMERIDFCRQADVSYHLVAHQVTPKANQDTGNYAKPNLYNIKGGGSFADSTDNVLAGWRPERGSDPKSTLMNFISDKIKKQKLVGVPGMSFIDYNRRDGRYWECDADWLEQRLTTHPGYDWRTDPDAPRYSPLAKLKGESPGRFQPVKQEQIYGPPKGNGLEEFEKEKYDPIAPEDAPF
jgi:twinkle protein